MGAKGNISIWMILARFGALLVLLPATGLAGESNSRALDPIEAPGAVIEATAVHAPSLTPTDRLPLTRAATRQRIDAMSPVDWLAGYGEVVVGRDGSGAANVAPR